MRGKCLFLILAMLPGAISLFAQYDIRLFEKLSHNLKIARSDAEKMAAMLAVADYYIEQSYMEGYQQSMDTAYAYVRQCEQLARKMKSDRELAKTYQMYSKAYNYESKYDTCIDYAQKAIDLFTALKDNFHLCLARSTMYRAIRYTQLAPQNKAYTEESVALALKTKNNLLCGIAYEDCAQNERYAGEPRQSLAHIKEAIKYYQLAGKKDLQHCYVHQALMHKHLHQIQEAFALSNQAVALAESLHDESYYMIELYSCVGQVYWDMKRMETAEIFTAKAMKVALKYIDPLAIVDEAMSLMDVYRTNNKPTEALKVAALLEKYYPRCDVGYQLEALACLIRTNILSYNYDKAEKYYKAIVPLLPMMTPSEVTAEPSFSVGHALAYYFDIKKNADSSQKYLNMMVKAMSSSDKEYIIDYLPIVHYAQFHIDSLKGNYLHAIKELHLYEYYKDTLFDLRKHGQITEMEVKYEVEKRKKDNELLKRETQLQAARTAKITTQKNWILAALILLTAIVILVITQYRLNQKSRLEIASKNLELEHLLSEKDELLEEKDWLLKEIHHRVKNNLQMVMSLLNTQSYFLNDQAAKDAIMNSQHRIHSMSLIHKKLYQSDNIASFNVADYFAELIDYYKVAFDSGNRIIFRPDLDRIELDASQAVPVGLILNEAVTNALKHAFPNGRRGTITILFKSMDHNLLLFSVKDDGVGIACDAANIQFDSLGMQLIHGFSGDLNAHLEITVNNGVEISLWFANNRLGREAFAVENESGRLTA